MKKSLIAAALVLFLIPCTAVFAEDAGIAKAVTAKISVTTGQKGAALADGSMATKLTLPANSSVLIEADNAFSGLYLQWDKPAGNYQLTAGTETRECGIYGFIHEYISLKAPQNSVRIDVPAGGVLCEVTLFGEGKLPDWVQVWQPPLEKADLLLLPTHADDEHLFFGGTMPTYAGERGLDVQVCYFNNHWGEPYRTHELLNGLWTVGIRAYPVIPEAPDRFSETLAQAKAMYGEDKMIKVQTDLIRRFKPYVVIGHDLGGEYGHGGHMLNAYTLAQALKVSGDESAYPDLAIKYGVWTPLKTYLHLYAQNKISMNWDIPLQKFGGKTAFQMAGEGYACHKSQQSYFTLSKKGVYDCRAFGLFQTAVGQDVEKNDFFEHIDLTSLKQQVGSSPVSSAPEQSTSAASSEPEAKGDGWVTVIVISLAVIAMAAGIAVGIRYRKRKG